MMATHPYPSSSQFSVGMAPNQGPSRNGYRLPQAAQGQMPATQYAYPTPHQPNMYLQPDVNQYGLVTPPTNTPAQFGSPLIANGGYAPLPGGTPSSQWSINALALSSVGATDSSLAYGYAPSPLMGQDPSCAAPGEVFTGGMHHHHNHHHGAVEGLGFPHSAMAHAHHAPPSMYRGGPGMGMKSHHGHLILGADGQPTTEIKKRSRTAQACERCRIRKARCFGGNPCNRCTKRRFVCEFSTAVRQRGPNKPQAGTSTAGSNSNDPGSVSSSASGHATKSPASPPKAIRRHSLPEGSNPAAYSAKTYSANDVTNLAAVEEGVAYSLPSSTVIPHLPTPTGGEYLAVPQANGLRSGDSSVYSAQYRSPLFAAHRSDSLDSASAPTTGSSADYPYTPISPATAFSPTLGMTPTVGGMYPNTVPAPAGADEQSYYAA